MSREMFEERRLVRGLERVRFTDWLVGSVNGDGCSNIYNNGSLCNVCFIY